MLDKTCVHALELWRRTNIKLEFCPSIPTQLDERNGLTIAAVGLNVTVIQFEDGMNLFVSIQLPRLEINQILGCCKDLNILE